ncbi:MAG: DUF695 domain-containing protein [Bacteroidales bacterium]|nr:DUF695 domain-containing protein [Bacteroidales bacterium]
METDSRYGEWWTAPAESDDGRLIMVTGRADVEKFRTNPRFDTRVTVSWIYDTDPAAAMPDDKTAAVMETVTEALQAAYTSDPVAVLTGIYTGAGQRDWVFYTLSLHIFMRKLNEALAAMPVLPLTFRAETDSDWEEYDEMALARVR